MADQLSNIGDAIKQASEAYAETMSTLSKAVQDIAGRAAGSEGGPVIENWLRLARMGKDGVVTAIEQSFEMWEREIRRISAQGSGAAKAPANPMEAWAENWRKATQAATGTGGMNEEFRKQSEAVQKILADGVRAWQKLWSSERE